MAMTDRPIRVLHVTECYSTGVSRAIRRLVSLRPDAEHHLLWTGDDDPAADGFATCTPLPATPPARVRAVARVARDIDADVVHAHSSWAGVYARVAPLSAHVVYQPHGYKLTDPDLPPPLRAAYAVAERLLGARTDEVVALSPQETRLAARLSPQAVRQLIPNVATLAGPVPAAPQPVVAMAGRVSAQKGPEFFAEVARRVTATVPEVRMVWIGSADDERLGDVLTKAGVEITGWVDQRRLATLLSSASAYLHTAAYEGFPLSVLDAAVCDLPIIVRDIPAFEGTPLERVTDPAEAADTVLEVLARGPARERALAGARRLVARMSVDAQRAAAADLYATARRRAVSEREPSLSA
ncbi:glycosyltransferase involved in cell wall biosynthesis [Knoellia remsis]|uniref:D-inositol 3-phosphate glycosyltransferase n=1 Tax=Knoellia remsis TaxID=407159 RepID=A0A2T0V0K2_9MICO|nr:glycosyltransferase [Knoellia remsis]PRY63674.1 glycosyltransferase involved in cell wall biosynthesis [Knoellia remsis]